MTETPGSFLEPNYDARADDSSHQHPYRSALLIVIAGYVVLTLLMLGIGTLLTHALDGSVGGWDRHVSEAFERHRTAGWNDVTQMATSSADTLPVVGVAALIVGLLALRRRWREAAFLTLALTLEITVFLSVTFVVDRPRPGVHRLNLTPATSSFPSGHTAAAVVLFGGAALIVMCLTRNAWARALSGFLAVVFALSIGFSRIYRGLHYPSDVFVGALFGCACLTLAAVAVRHASVRVARARGSGESADRRLDRGGQARLDASSAVG